MGRIKSLRKSLVLYVVAFTAIALALCDLTFAACDSAREAIYASYPPAGERYYLTNEKGEQLGEGAYIGTSPRPMSAQDQRMTALLEWFPVAAAPVYSALCILAAAFLFYRNRLKEPLAQLQKASEQISANNLNFALTYEREDELGELCASFETMRAALADNFSRMWRQMEERKRLNAAFAHDLRTPLTVLKGYHEMLQAEQDESTDSVISTMGRHIARLERYVESMSQLQRLEDRQPEYRNVSLQVILSMISENTDILCRESSKTITLENQTFSTQFSLDISFLSQVISNLSANAVRYADSGITLLLWEPGEGLALSVSDDGPGFDRDMLAHGTDPYATGERDGGEHFGLGLYICNLLCQRHGGWLRIENTSSGARVTAFFQNG